MASLISSSLSVLLFLPTTAISKAVNKLRASPPAKSINILLAFLFIFIFFSARPNFLSLKARFKILAKSKSLKDLRVSTRQRDNKAEFKEKDGFSVVAPIKIKVPRST